MSKDLLRIVYPLVALFVPPAFVFFIFKLVLCFVPSIDPYFVGVGFTVGAVVGFAVAAIVLTELAQ